MESTNYIRQAIQFAAQEDPTEMLTSIGAALSEKITDAINLKKIEIASNLFSNDINEYITDGGTRRKCDHPDGRRKGNEVEEEDDDDVEENIANFGDKKAKPFTKDDAKKKNGKSNNVKENIANFGDKKAKPFTKDDAKNSQAKKKTKNGAKKD